MRRWLVMLLLALLAGGACQPGAGSPLPEESLARGSLLLGRRDGSLAQLVLAELLKEKPLAVEVDELAGQVGSTEFLLQPVTMRLQVTHLELRAGAGAWPATMDVAVSDPNTSLIIESSSGNSQCEVLVSVADSSARFTLLAPGGESALAVEDLVLQMAAPVVSLDAYCGLAGDEQLLQLLQKHFQAALEEGGRLMAERLAAVASEQLLGGLDWQGSVLPQWPEADTAGSLGYQVIVAGAPELGEQAAVVELEAGFRAEPAACLPAGTPDPAGTPAGLEMQQLLERYPQAEVALAVTDQLAVQATLEAWRAGLFCRALSAGALEQLHLRDYFPSLEAWSGGEVRLLLRPGARPEARVDATASQGELPALVTDLPEVNFDFYLATLGVDLRVLSVVADVQLRLRPYLDSQGGGVRLAGKEIGAVTVTYHEALAEGDQDLKTGARRLLEDVVELLAGQLPPWPVTLPPGTGTLLGIEHPPGYSVILLGP